MNTKISVIIPTCNRPKLLIKCLQSLVNQSIPTSEFEVIVVGDGPNNATLFALLPFFKKQELRLSYLETPKKMGPAAARNFGWRVASSDLIAFTDDDCLPDKNWLRAFIEVFEQTAAPVALTGKTEVPLSGNPTDAELNTAHLGSAEFITANCACHKAVLLTVGGFDQSYQLAWREDSDLHFKLLTRGINIIPVPEAKVVHPVRKSQWGQSIKEQKKGVYDALLFRKFPELYRSKIKNSTIWNYYLINLFWLLLAAGLFLQNVILIWTSSLGLLVLLGIFLLKRIRKTNKGLSHLLEMTFTSMLIPSVSVYWRSYGCVKFRVIFI
jgi:glycosyltransferase involved in cell wall biosynthesis